MLYCCTSVMSEISLFNRPQAFNWKQNRLRLPRVLNKSPFIKADGATNHKQGFVEFSEKKKKGKTVFRTTFPQVHLSIFQHLKERLTQKAGNKNSKMQKIHCIIQVSGGPFIYFFFLKLKSSPWACTVRLLSPPLKQTHHDDWIWIFGWTAPLRQSSLWGGVTN